MPTVTLSFNTYEEGVISDAMALIGRLTGRNAGLQEIEDKSEARVYVYDGPLMELAKEHCGTGSATKQWSTRVGRARNGST